ncbi:hypothetical protein AWN88_04475 [Agrobacterium tumefaciens]|nr:hypothetical protein AWN88_04475 [Agrobacterium tumefaciens]KAJ35618.1 hypothetical protein BW45_28665 [Agrobacterium tumefaciens]
MAEESKSSSPRKRGIWLWLLFGALAAVVNAGVFAYIEITAMIEDLGRLWDDLVQLFWLIVPDGQK